MKPYLPLILIALSCTILTSCDLITGIFKAGVWSGIIMVVIILALVIWLVVKIFGRRD
jgi:hypothetical protein